MGATGGTRQAAAGDDRRAEAADGDGRRSEEAEAKLCGVDMLLEDPHFVFNTRRFWMSTAIYSYGPM